MRFARHSELMLVTAFLWSSIASGQGISGAAAPAVRAVASPSPTPTKTPVAAAKTVVLPAPPPPGNATGAGSPVQGTSAVSHAPQGPAFELSEIYYFEPATGTKFAAYQNGNTWFLPLVDTMKAAGVTFLFDSKVPKQEIAEVVEKKVCCYALLVAGQSVTVNAFSFSGDRVFVRATLPDMQTWPKTIQLRMFHQGILASPADASKASASGGSSGLAGVGQAQAPVASRQGSGTALIPRPFMDYKSLPATVKTAKVSYFAKFLYPTFSHARCTDCHSMGDAATVNARHAAGGMPEVHAANPNVAGCGNGSCHTKVNDWRTPPFAFGINWQGKGAKEVCNIVTGHLSSAQDLHKHFHGDARVVWAVSDGWIPANGHGKGQGVLPTAPPHNQQAWFQLVDYWINGGFPCP